LSSLAKRSRREDGTNLEDSQRDADSTHQEDSRYVQHETNRLDVAQDSELAEKIRLNRQSRREWMDHHSHQYAELADFADGSASSRPEEQPQLLYANFQEASQEGPIYAQVDKSKKTNRK
jgi:hypothetical protein